MFLLIASKLSFIAIGSGIAGLTGLVGTYLGTQVTVKDELKDHLLPEDDDFSDQGADKVDKAKKDAEIRTIFINTNNQHQVEIRALQRGCRKRYSIVTGNIFFSSKREIVDLVKQICVYPIREKIIRERLFLLNPNDLSQTGRGKAKGKYIETGPPVPTDKNTIPLDEELAQIKIIKSEIKAIRHLKNGCKTKYEIGYTDKTQKVLELARIFCAERPTSETPKKENK